MEVLRTVILIGQFDSPFARRVGITLSLYGIAFEHRPWSIMGDADRLAEVNPLIRVPTLILDNGDVLIETSSIIDYLDSLVPAEKRLLPQTNPERYRMLKTMSLATGISDMAVRLFYEQRLHAAPSASYVTRITRQAEGALHALDKERAPSGSKYWFGETLSQADIAITSMWRHLSETHPTIAVSANYPALSAHAARMEELPVFQKISQPFIAPA
jgi:glutathione S-transferase